MTVDRREEIVEYLPAMRAFAMSLTKNAATADDIVQDTVVKAWGNFEQYEEGTKLKAWLFTILRNTFYSYRRKRQREVEDVEGVWAATLATKPAHDGRLQLADFMKAFHRLSLPQREAVLLVGALGFSYEEAAKMCDVPVGTLKSRANRGRAELAVMMGADENDADDITDAATRAVMSKSAGRVI